MLGAACELAGFRAAYALNGESAPDSIRRAKPTVVLVDACHEIVHEPASLGPALMTGAGVVFFGAGARVRDIAVLAAAARATVLSLPDDIDRLPALLTAAATSARGRARSE